MAKRARARQISRDRTDDDLNGHEAYFLVDLNAVIFPDEMSEGLREVLPPTPERDKAATATPSRRSEA